jgi:catechol 2,3-dioxygenase
MANRLLSQLAHVELVSEKPAESVDFFINVLGLEKSAEQGSSVYLRGWGDWLHHSVVVTEGPGPQVAHSAWRTEGPEELERAVASLEASGAGEGWAQETTGHGPAYRFRGPGGQLLEVFWESELYQAPPELRSEFPNRPQRPATRGTRARQIDHISWGSTDPRADAEWYRDHLGFRFMEYAAIEDTSVFATITTNERAHDMGLIADLSGEPGRVHHFAFWLDEVMDVHQAADTLIEAGVPIEYGPGRHGISESAYLYFREPGGMRIELFSGGYRNYLPDWEPVRWAPEEGSNSFYRNVEPPESFLLPLPLTEAEKASGADQYALPISTRKWASVVANA